MKTNRKIKRPIPRPNKGKWKLPQFCSNPDCGAEHSIKEVPLPSTQLIRGEETHCEVNKYRCTACEMTFQSPAQATEGVKIAVKAYQEKHGLLTAEMIKEKRQALVIKSADRLAGLLNGTVSSATLKRIESGTHVQDPSTNSALVTAFEKLTDLNHYVVVVELTEYVSTVCSHNKVTGYKTKHDDWSKPFAGLYNELENEEPFNFEENQSFSYYV